jgi:NADH-quinone oxidoreductase subunit N
VSVIAVFAQATFAGPEIDWWALSPLLVLAGGGLVLLVVAALTPTWPRGTYAAATVATASAALVLSIILWYQVQDDGPQDLVGQALRLDPFGLFLAIVICSTVILSALVSDEYLRRRKLEGAEIYGLYLAAASGALVMAWAADLIVLFLGLETLSIALYVMAGSDLRRLRSQESAMKYFILGAFSSAFFLYGIALVYGATGTTNLEGIATYLNGTVLLEDRLLLAGMALLLVGLGFKAAIVPFHWWTPDVYQGAPTPITGFFASCAKAAAFAALLRVFVETFSTYQTDWQPAVLALAVITLLVGAIVAIVQTDVKRMMAYSSISHAGFILVGVEVATSDGVSASLVYLLAYTILVIGTFAVIALVGESTDGDQSFAAYRGLANRKPLLAAVFTLLLLAQAGVPFTSGFIAKFSVIAAAAEAEEYLLAVVAMVAAVIAIFLYLRVTVTMYMTDDEAVPAADDRRISISAGAGLALVLAVGFTIVAGVVPNFMVDFAQEAVVGFSF